MLGAVDWKLDKSEGQSDDGAEPSSRCAAPTGHRRLLVNSTAVGSLIAVRTAPPVLARWRSPHVVETRAGSDGLGRDDGVSRVPMVGRLSFVVWPVLRHLGITTSGPRLGASASRRRAAACGHEQGEGKEQSARVTDDPDAELRREARRELREAAHAGGASTVVDRLLLNKSRTGPSPDPGHGQRRCQPVGDGVPGRPERRAVFEHHSRTIRVAELSLPGARRLRSGSRPGHATQPRAATSRSA
jgi:hypothetical protein